MEFKPIHHFDESGFEGKWQLNEIIHIIFTNYDQRLENQIWSRKKKEFKSFHFLDCKGWMGAIVWLAFKNGCHFGSADIRP